MSDELPSILDLGVDIADVPAPELLPPGDFVAEVRKAEPKVSGAGNHYVSVQLYISPEDYPADYDVAEAPDGTILTYNRVPWPQSKDDRRGINTLRKVMDALGVPVKGSKVDLDEWVGKKTLVTVGHSSYEGELRIEAKKIRKDI